MKLRLKRLVWPLESSYEVRRVSAPPWRSSNAIRSFSCSNGSFSSQFVSRVSSFLQLIFCLFQNLIRIQSQISNFQFFLLSLGTFPKLAMLRLFCSPKSWTRNSDSMRLLVSAIRRDSTADSESASVDFSTTAFARSRTDLNLNQILIN